MLRTHTCGELNINDLGKEVVLSGWVQKSRDLGGMTFIDVRDRYGITQLAFNTEDNEVLCQKARTLGREFVIQAKGTVIERSSKNTKIPTGEIEIKVTSLEILNESKNNIVVFCHDDITLETKNWGNKLIKLFDVIFNKLYK
jgi:aspartyl-tRNA synthetase